MKIALLTTYFPKPDNPVMGIWALREMQALKRAGVDINVISPTSWVPRLPLLPRRLAAWANCPLETSLEGIPVYYPRWPLYQVGPLMRRARTDPKPQLELALRFSRGRLKKLLVGEQRPDVLYAHHASTCGWIAAQLSRELKIPLVVSEHAYVWLEQCAVSPPMKSLFAEVIAQANCIAPVSRTMEQMWKQLFPQARTAALLNGADPLPADLANAPRSERLRERVIVYCAAALNSGKAVPDLIRAFAPLARENPSLLLRIAGADGPDRPLIERLTAEPKIAAQVELLGALPHREVLAGMASSDLFALLSLQESLGIVYLEAMSAALPLIWTTAVGAREFLRDGVHGFEVEPKDIPAAQAALRKLIDDAALRKKMGEANREFLLANLTWDAHAKKLLGILESAVREGPR